MTYFAPSGTLNLNSINQKPSRDQSINQSKDF